VHYLATLQAPLQSTLDGLDRLREGSSELEYPTKQYYQIGTYVNTPGRTVKLSSISRGF
jgi:hypothetical protein